MFRVTKEEKDELVTECDRLVSLKHSSALPRVFTEHGALMAASVLKSKRAVEMSIFVVRAFVRYRAILVQNAEFSKRLLELESKIAHHDESIRNVVTALRELLQTGSHPGVRSIGFRTKNE